MFLCLFPSLSFSLFLFFYLFLFFFFPFFLVFLFFTYLQHFLNFNFVSCFPSKCFISSSKILAFDCVLQSNLLVAFWIFPFQLMMFLSAFCFLEPVLFLILGLSPIKSENRLVIFCVFVLMKSEQSLILRNKGGLLLLKGEPIVSSCEFRAEQTGP